MRNRSAKNYCLLTVGTLQLLAGVGVGVILPTPAVILPTPAPSPTPGKTIDSDGLQLRPRLRLRSSGRTPYQKMKTPRIWPTILWIRTNPVFIFFFTIKLCFIFQGAGDITPVSPLGYVSDCLYHILYFWTVWKLGKLFSFYKRSKILKSPEYM